MFCFVFFVFLKFVITLLFLETMSFDFDFVLFFLLWEKDGRIPANGTRMNRTGAGSVVDQLRL